MKKSDITSFITIYDYSMCKFWLNPTASPSLTKIAFTTPALSCHYGSSFHRFNDTCASPNFTACPLQQMVGLLTCTIKGPTIGERMWPDTFPLIARLAPIRLVQWGLQPVLEQLVQVGLLHRTWCSWTTINTNDSSPSEISTHNARFFY